MSTTTDLFIRTHTGKLVNPLDLDPAKMCIEDVAYALASLPRYGGHSRLTVAQHCCMVADQLRGDHETEHFAFDGLMHDASESMGLLDLPSPVKYRPEFSFYREAENLAGETLSRVFGFAWPKPAVVHEVDRRMRVTEQRDLMGREPQLDDQYQPYPFRIRVWPRHTAEYGFLNRYRLLNPRKERA